MRAMRMRRGNKTEKQGAAGGKKREAPSWQQHLRRDGCEGHPKIIIMVVRGQILTTMMMILGCPEKRQKTNAQQAMEPPVDPSVPKPDKKEREKRHSSLLQLYINEDI
jgi:hypothetical protein